MVPQPSPCTAQHAGKLSVGAGRQSLPPPSKVFRCFDRDCCTFVEKVAAEAGLDVPAYRPVYPQDYLTKLKELNGLKNKHGVAVAIESITLPDGFLISRHDQVPTGKGGNQYQKRRTTQVEIGDHRIGYLKFLTGHDV